jgi:molybdate transport system ATP-binding protein
MNRLTLDIDCAGARGFRLRVQGDLPLAGVTAIYGPSGSGKSTLLDCIAGLRHPSGHSVIRFGDITWLEGGVASPPWERQVGYIFQDARLFPHLDVRGNLQYAKDRSRPGGPELAEVVDWLGLEELLSHRPAALSGGQGQRVAIGRALLSAPRLLLLDEPLANLDHQAKMTLQAHLQRLAGELQLPMLYVSHDIEEVSQLADQLLILDDGQLVAQGPLLDLCTRLDTRLSHEEQAAAIALATIRGHDTRFGLTELDLEGQPLWVNHLPQSPGMRRRVRIPARDVSVCRERPRDSSILNILPVTLSEIEHTTDSRVLLKLALGNQDLLARITRKSASQLDLKVGDRLFAQIKSAALLMESADQP